jgi:hypothetical protein
MTNLMGVAGQRFFADPSPGADEATFAVANDSAAYYQSPYYRLHQTQLEAIPTPTSVPAHFSFDQVVGADLLDAINSAKRIVFHAVGDTGAAKVNRIQTVQTALKDQARVADAMAAEVVAGGTGGPAFFFHLGDIVYNFGEAQYYYDQFYEPYRVYDRPIFAIPGNHDGVVVYGGPGGSTPQAPSLDAYLRNFCSPTAVPSPDAGNLVRSTMTQPGPYFTLDAPFVSIIGLYTNVLEGPGVISSQGGHYPIGDEQLGFLTSELQRLQPMRAAGARAVVIACHHPPLSVDAKHGGTTGLGADIDNCCRTAGLWPDAVLSGHAHLYQRFTRATAGRQIPYVVCGSGGYAATSPSVAAPPVGTTIGDVTIAVAPLVEFGFLSLTVDMSTSRPTLTIEFRTPGRDANNHIISNPQDSVTIDLNAGTILGARAQPHAVRAGKAAKRKFTGKKTAKKRVPATPAKRKPHAAKTSRASRKR